jgi:short-subunit dehydrogenase
MGRDPMSPMGLPDPMNGRMAEQQAKIRNTERQKRLQSDTERLVDLVNELKTQVGGESAISATDLSKRAEEIEKLAKSVKERMKG